MGANQSKLWAYYKTEMKANPLRTKALVQFFLMALQEKIGGAPLRHIVSSALFASLVTTRVSHHIEVRSIGLTNPLVKLAMGLLVAIPVPVIIQIFFRRFYLVAKPGESFSDLIIHFRSWASENLFKTIKSLWLIYLPAILLVQKVVPEAGRTLTMQVFGMCLGVLGQASQRSKKEQEKRDRELD